MTDKTHRKPPRRPPAKERAPHNLVADLIFSTDHVLSLHSDRIDRIDRARKAHTATDEQALLSAMRIAEFKAMLDVMEPYMDDEQRRRLRTVAIATLGKRASRAETPDEAAPWLSFCEQVLAKADALSQDELETVRRATDELRAKLKPQSTEDA